jgi:hypothetical protein
MPKITFPIKHNFLIKYRELLMLLSNNIYIQGLKCNFTEITFSIINSDYLKESSINIISLSLEINNDGNIHPLIRIFNNYKDMNTFELI